MIVTPIKTPIVKANDDIKEIIASSIKSIPEKSILVITSKIISTCENRFVKKNEDTKEEKHELVKNEAELYIESHLSKYNMMLTVKQNFLAVNAGIDESNADNQYLLWPKDPQESVNNIWEFIRNHYNITNVGVTISDSSSIILNWGVVGRAITYCGFNPLKSYVGKADLFGKIMKMEQMNLMQSITDAAVCEMGEGDECTPMAIASDFTQAIEFQDHKPTKEELAKLKIDIKDDVYYPILQNANWQKGNAKVALEKRIQYNQY